MSRKASNFQKKVMSLGYRGNQMCNSLKKVEPVTDNIRSAYKSSKNIYDDVLTRSNIWSQLYIKVFWDNTDDNEIAETILKYIPDDFSGKILDVPVGTAVFTEKKWRILKDATITCLDYSEDMLEQAKGRLSDCKNISFIQEMWDSFRLRIKAVILFSA